jgi:nucleoid-associated protein YgaU
MGIFDFVKEAGEKLFSGKEARAEARQETEEALVKHVRDIGLKADNFAVEYDDGVATIRGKTVSQEEKEKIILLVGNTKGVARVDDQLSVETPAPEAVFFTVQRGDTLSKIAKEQYGNAGKYMVIFEANKPMLKDPDRIYPGQALRIPPLKP